MGFRNTLLTAGVVVFFLVDSANRVLPAFGQDNKSNPRAESEESKDKMPAAGTQVKITVQVDDKEGQKIDIGCLVFLPVDYAENPSCPLMLFLHGAGERGDDINLVKAWGPPKLVEADQEFRDGFPFVLVSPQCPKTTWWDVNVTASILDQAVDKYKIDKDRVYVTGLSMGGFGTWALAAKRPDQIAAIIPICGGGDKKSASHLKEMPIWAFHGEKDSVVGVEQSQSMIDAIKKLGGHPQLTVYADVNHNSWEQTYANPKIYEWLLKHSR